MVGGVSAEILLLSIAILSSKKSIKDLSYYIQYRIHGRVFDRSVGKNRPPLSHFFFPYKILKTKIPFFSLSLSLSLASLFLSIRYSAGNLLVY